MLIIMKMYYLPYNGVHKNQDHNHLNRIRLRDDNIRCLDSYHMFPCSVDQRYQHRTLTIDMLFIFIFFQCIHYSGNSFIATHLLKHYFLKSGCKLKYVSDFYKKNTKALPFFSDVMVYETL